MTNGRTCVLNVCPVRRRIDLTGTEHMNAKKPQRTKRQHYVPRCYLSGFTKDGENIWAFDKTTGRPAFRSGLMNVAQEIGFYDLPVPASANLPEVVGPVDIAEKALGPGDASLAEAIRKLVHEVETTATLTRDTVMLMSLHVVRQWLRTRRARQHLAETYEAHFRVEFGEYVRRKQPDLFPHLDQLRFVMDETQLTALQLQRLLDPDAIADLAELLLKHIWVVGVNRTIQPFYTSDNPVVKKANAKRPGRSFTGLRSPGIEIAFPVTSRHILLICERSYFADGAHLHGRAVSLSPSDVERYNCLQVQQSYRQVYCETDQFEQARGECRLHPEVCKLDRPHVEVIREGDLVKFLCSE